MATALQLVGPSNGQFPINKLKLREYFNFRKHYTIMSFWSQTSKIKTVKMLIFAELCRLGCWQFFFIFHSPGYLRCARGRCGQKICQEKRMSKMKWHALWRRRWYLSSSIHHHNYIVIIHRGNAAGNAIASVRPFVYTLSSGTTDRWPWTFACE